MKKIIKWLRLNLQPFFYRINTRVTIGCLLIMLGLFSVSEVSAQATTKPSKAQKAADKKKQQQIRSAEKAEKIGREKHEAIQTKEVRKRLRRNRRRYQHVDSFDPRPNFIQRIFHRKRPSAY